MGNLALCNILTILCNVGVTLTVQVKAASDAHPTGVATQQAASLWAM
jgi:hypothetical protein